MKFSRLQETSKLTDMVSTFYGYNHQPVISDGYFYDMKNMSSSYYPLLSPRPRRGSYRYKQQIFSKPPTVNGIYHKDKFIYVDGTYLYIDGKMVSNVSLENSRKTFVGMGAYLIIFPDNFYINTQTTSDHGYIEASFDSASSEVKLTMCNADGDAYTVKTTGSTAPSSPKNLEYWIDTSSTPHSLKQWSSTSSTWTTIATSYVKISCTNIAADFSQYDAVKITGFLKSDVGSNFYTDTEGKTSILYQAYHNKDADGVGDYVIVVGFIDKAVTLSSEITLKRQIPKMDYVVESNNRLWGCRYGKNVSGKMVNEIYACKLGDFKNWNCFMGTSEDSYTASCGTDGAWTGAVVHQGYPIFMKEHVLHKVYGSYPSEYQIQTTECNGVQSGASASLAIVGSTLYYKSRTGVMAYDGSLPSSISTVFGNDTFSGTTGGVGAVAGVLGSKYYISCKSDEDSLWYLMVYDSRTGLWHKEDNLHARAFTTYEDELYYIDDETGQICTILGSGKQSESPVEWMAETGIVGTSVKKSTYSTTSLPGKKYVSQMLVRMQLQLNTRVRFYIQYDSVGQWEHVASVTGTSLRTYSVPIRPKRCDHFRLRIEGVGDAKIYSITKYLEEGSDY